MTDKELRRMSRLELIDILYQMKKNEEGLQARIEELEQKLEAREIQIAQAGSIAEAALAVNGVFEAAQRAAEDYLNAVRKLHGSGERLQGQEEPEGKAPDPEEK